MYVTYSLCSEIQPGCNIQFYKPNSLALAVLGLYSSAKDLPRINLKNAAFLPDEEKKGENKNGLWQHYSPFGKKVHLVLSQKMSKNTTSNN